MPVRVPVVAVVLALGLTCGLVALAVLSLAPAAPGGHSRASSLSGPTPSQPAAELAPMQVLCRWDRQRATAWARHDTAALSRLYAPGSSAGAADVRLLRSYIARGIAVPELRMQVVRGAVLVDRPRRLVVRVVERLATRSALVGQRAVQLPRDAASVHVVELRRRRGAWLVAAVQ